MKKLNLGCGTEILQGWINLDSVANPDIDVIFNLNDLPGIPLPFKENEIELFLLSHLLEHMERPLNLMQELWRVAAPGAKMIIRVPHGGNDEAWIDPTHLRPYFPRSFTYFGQPKYHMFDYGYSGDWECQTVYLATPLAKKAEMNGDEAMNAIHYQRNLCTEMVGVLRAIKPARRREKKLMTAAQIKLVGSIPRDPNFFEQSFVS